MARDWAHENGVPPTTFVTPLHPDRFLSDIRNEIKAWFRTYSPTEADDWSQAINPGTLEAEVLQYDLVVYTYTPAHPLPDLPSQPRARDEERQETEDRRDEGTAHADATRTQIGADGQCPDQAAQDNRPTAADRSVKPTPAGTRDDIPAVWTNDRDKTWDNLRSAGPAQEKHGSDDLGATPQRQPPKPDWASPALIPVTGPQPLVHLFRPRDQMSVRCEKVCCWCGERCYQARNIRDAGHNGRCLCARHTQMALAQTRNTQEGFAEPSPQPINGRTGAANTGKRAMLMPRPTPGTLADGGTSNGDTEAATMTSRSGRPTGGGPTDMSSTSRPERNRTMTIPWRQLEHGRDTATGRKEGPSRGEARRPEHGDGPAQQRQTTPRSQRRKWRWTGR